MRKLAISALLLMAFCFLTQSSAFAQAALQDWGININGTAYDYNNLGQPDPTTLSGMNASGFSTSTGLGTMTFTFNPGVAGTYFVNGYFDEEASVPFFNEYGVVNGSAPSGESWEIAQVNPSVGGIQFFDGTSQTLPNTLDNTNNLPVGSTNYLDNCTTAPCNGDVATALGFSFTLTAGEEAVITFAQSTTDPGGFNLEEVHPTDPNNTSETDVYLDGSISIQPACTGPNCGGGPPPPTPEPSGLILLGTGLLGIFGTGIRARFGRS